MKTVKKFIRRLLASFVFVIAILILAFVSTVFMVASIVSGDGQTEKTVCDKDGNCTTTVIHE